MKSKKNKEKIEESNEVVEAAFEKVEVEYTKGKLSRRVAAFILDLFIIAITTFTIYALANMGFRNASFYKNAMATMDSIKIESGIYVTYQEQVVDIVTYVETEEIPGTENKKTFIANRLEAFYLNDAFFADLVEYEKYQNRKLDYTVDSQTLFYKDGDVVKEKSGVNPSLLLTFYEDEFNYHAKAFLYLNTDYTNANKTLFTTAIVILVCSMFLTYTIFVLVLPLTVFKRGRQTCGMKMSKVAYIGVDAVNIPTGKYIGRFFFSFFYYCVLNFVGFLIPTIVTASMMFASKTNQTVDEYVFNDYVVDVSNQDIYLDYFDYIDHKDKIKFKDMRTQDTRRF